MGLTAKQQQFCREYLVDLNATRAAVRAGYSAKTAQERGSRLLSNVMVATEIERLRAERSARTELTADWVLLHLRDEAGDRGEGATQAGRIKALELLGKHLGMFRDKVELSGPNGGPIPLTADQRAEAVAAILAAAAARLPPPAAANPTPDPA